MNFLESLDHAIFSFINSTFTHTIFDLFFPFISNLSNQKWFYFGLIPAIMVVWVWKQRAKSGRLILAVALLAGISDGFGYHLLKKSIDRIRPNNHSQVESVLRLPHSPQSGSFPSNHAMSSFAIASFLGFFYPTVRVYMLIFAFLTAYSRVYVGVHFPSDVAGGAIIGVLLAQLWRRLLALRWSFFGAS